MNKEFEDLRAKRDDINVALTILEKMGEHDAAGPLYNILISIDCSMRSLVKRELDATANKFGVELPHHDKEVNAIISMITE